MKISVKLLGGFGIVALICGLVGGVGWYGTSSTKAGLSEVADVRLPSVENVGLMMESMREIQAIERTIVNPTLTAEIRRQEIAGMERPWKAFEEGMQRYKALPKTAEETALLAKLDAGLSKWKVEHDKLAGLVSHIKLNNVGNLETILVARRLDHVRWVATLNIAITENKEFKGQLDPKLCGLGRWMADFKSGDAEFDAMLHKFDEPHEKLHNLGAEIVQSIGSGDSREARKKFDAEVVPTLKIIEGLFDEDLASVKKDLDSLSAGLELAFGVEKQALEELIATMDQITKMSAELAASNSAAAVRSAGRSQALAAIAVLLGIAAALSFGYFISRGITEPLHRAVAILAKIGLGDTSETMEMGRAVNCSSHKKCGKAECPSYNRVDHCWVTSGSFAAVKHCPRAKKGEDCRTCEVYGAKTEMEELGSILGGLSNNLAAREHLAMAIAGGDLTQEVELASDKDLLGKGLQIMVNNLRDIIGEVQTAGDQIASGAAQVSDASQSLSQGATESAASLEEITSSMNEMASQTKTNAENAAQANQLSDQTRKAAENGTGQMQSMVKAMSEINESGKSISKIIKVIDEIAFQTNLLALNAAVEAARAGKHGKGFAVVAEEVRNLAARSAQAARETAELIESSVQKTENGAGIATNTAAALTEIVRGVSKVSDLLQEIAASSNEQAQGIAEVTQGLGQIDQVTQQNTANAEETAAAAEELSGQSATLQQMLARFRLRATGTQGMAGAPLALEGPASGKSGGWPVL
ncbi:MAG: hypothetical protein A2521_01550 [Deltaproteobacteria bacterium RIFOXYD12_FULL_57_12]|nr:MAG: hypothetical protein A2521_01550 [Deltaproteobacteria bacterium RIFOXYD12_FULL_57_12]